MEPLIKKQFETFAMQMGKLNKSQIAGMPEVLTEAFERTKLFVQDFQKKEDLKSYKSELDTIFSYWDNAIISLEPINPLFSDILKFIRKYFLNDTEFLLELQDENDKLKLFVLLDKSIHFIQCQDIK